MPERAAKASHFFLGSDGEHIVVLIEVGVVDTLDDNLVVAVNELLAVNRLLIVGHGDFGNANCRVKRDCYVVRTSHVYFVVNISTLSISV